MKILVCLKKIDYTWAKLGLEKINFNVIFVKL